MKVYITTIVPDTSKEVSTPLFKLVTLIAPTKEGILNFLSSEKLDPHTCYLGNQPAIDVLTTDGIFNEFYHIREQLIVPIEETPFPDPLQGIQRVGVNLNVGIHQQGWIEVQCLPIQSLMQRRVSSESE